ncbi:MAG: hypothetical protein WD077_01080 [Bacteroidia bacterium]
MKKLIQALFVSLLVCASSNVYGQNTNISDSFDSTQTYKIELNDGSAFFGNILLKDSINMVMRTSSIPKLEIPILKIKRIDEIDESNLKNGSYWFPNPNATRYLFSPSAFNLKKGEAYYQNTYLSINSFNVGITDNISIGGGLEFISTFGSLAAGSFEPIFFITPKIGVEVTESFHAGGGLLYASLPLFGSFRRRGFGIGYGVGTYGSTDHNITGGLGWGFFEEEFSERPIITFSGMTRIAKKTALVTENWFVPIDSYYGVFSYGIRFFSETMAVDLAFINNADLAEVLIVGMPYISFVVKL